MSGGDIEFDKLMVERSISTLAPSNDMMMLSC
jgi:hypothetical protein